MTLTQLLRAGTRSVIVPTPWFTEAAAKALTLTGVHLEPSGRHTRTRDLQGQARPYFCEGYIGVARLDFANMDSDNFLTDTQTTPVATQGQLDRIDQPANPTSSS